MTQKYSYTYTDFYKSYDGEATKQQYKTVIELFCQHLYTQLLRGYEVRIPGGLGYLCFYKKKSTTVIDWVKTNHIYGEYNKNSKDKKRIMNHNNHTDGYVVYPWWINTNHTVVRKSFFKFVLSRRKKKMLSKFLIEQGSIGNFNER